MTDVKQFLLSHLDLSISAHNSQPFLFRFPQPNQVQIFCNEKRLLPIADPHHKDLHLSLGALLETLEILLNSQGFQSLHTEITLSAQPIASVIFGASAKISSVEQLEFLKKRFSYRGAFTKTRASNSLPQNQNLIIQDDESIRDAVGTLYDQVNLKFLRKQNYLEELYLWLRFSNSHPYWFKDGLNAQAMALNPIETWGASWLLKPRVFKFLDRIHMAEPIVSEKSKITSAPYLAFIYSSEKISHIEQGRIFLRVWIELTRAGLYGAPLSLLTDDPAACAHIFSLLGLPSDTTLINVLRCGPLPDNFKFYPRARLRGNELLYV